MRVGVCMGVYVWCGWASVVQGEGCTYVCVCVLHLLCVAYVICGCACIEHAHASVPHKCPKVLCVRMREYIYVHAYNMSCLCLYVVSVCELLCLGVSLCVWVHMFKTACECLCVCGTCVQVCLCVLHLMWECVLVW